MDHASAPEHDTSELPSVADGIVHQLDPRYVDLERQTGWIASAVVSLIALTGTAIYIFAAWPPIWLTALLTIGVFLLLVAVTVFWQRWPAIDYRYTSYRVDAEGLEIRRGVYFRSVTTVPRSRIQHTDVSQGPLQRRFGLGTLTVHTAGTGAAEVHLPGLLHELALRIRDHLLPRQTEDAV